MAIYEIPVIRRYQIEADSPEEAICKLAAQLQEPPSEQPKRAVKHLRQGRLEPHWRIRKLTAPPAHRNRPYQMWQHIKDGDTVGEVWARLRQAERTTSKDMPHRRGRTLKEMERDGYITFEIRS